MSVDLVRAVARRREQLWRALASERGRDGSRLMSALGVIADFGRGWVNVRAIGGAGWLRARSLGWWRRAERPTDSTT